MKIASRSSRLSSTSGAELAVRGRRDGRRRERGRRRPARPSARSTAAVEEYRGIVVGEVGADPAPLWRLRCTGSRSSAARSHALAVSARSSRALWDIEEVLGPAGLQLSPSPPTASSCTRTAPGATPSSVERPRARRPGLVTGAGSVAEPVLPIQGDGVCRRAARPRRTPARRRRRGRDRLGRAATPAGDVDQAGPGARALRHLVPRGAALPENPKGLARSWGQRRFPSRRTTSLHEEMGLPQDPRLGALRAHSQDLLHCSGVLEARAIAAMAEVYFAGCATIRSGSQHRGLGSRRYGHSRPSPIEKCNRAGLDARLLTEPLVFADGGTEQRRTRLVGNPSSMSTSAAPTRTSRRGCRFSSIRRRAIMAGRAWRRCGSGSSSAPVHGPARTSRGLHHEECELVRLRQSRGGYGQLVAAQARASGVCAITVNNKSSNSDGIVAATVRHHALRLAPSAACATSSPTLALSAAAGDPGSRDVAATVASMPRHPAPLGRAARRGRRRPSAYLEGGGKLGGLRYLRVCFRTQAGSECARLDRRR